MEEWALTTPTVRTLSETQSSTCFESTRVRRVRISAFVPIAGCCRRLEAPGSNPRRVIRKRAHNHRASRQVCYLATVLLQLLVVF